MFVNSTRPEGKAEYITEVVEFDFAKYFLGYKWVWGLKLYEEVS